MAKGIISKWVGLFYFITVYWRVWPTCLLWQGKQLIIKYAIFIPAFIISYISSKLTGLAINLIDYIGHKEKGKKMAATTNVVWII